MRLLPLCVLCVFATLRFQAHAQTPAPKLPQLTDPALRLEVIATYPDVEAPTTVTGAPDGSIYVGCDPRDTRLNTAKPECFIVRLGTFDSPDQIRLPDGNLAPPGPPHRQRTVFASGLYSPAGSAWHDGWLYVIHDPLLSRFRDTDGDGIADVREDLITNLGIPPYEGLNDHVVSGFTLGMDGFFYISVGDRGVYKARGRDGSEITLRGGGIIRCRPDGTQLAIFSTGTRNHLSVALDAEDHAFTLDNTDDGNGWWTRLTHHIEGGYYGYPYDYRSAQNYGVTQPSQQTLDAMKQHSPELLTLNPNLNLNPPPSPAGESEEGLRLGVRVRLREAAERFLPAMTDFGPGSPTGGLCYLSDGLPEPYRGKLFFSEWGKQNVSVIEVAREGATFRFVKSTPLVQGGAGVDFRPMQLSVAADGSLLIADWGWGGWKGPKTTGTIWRVSWPEAHPAPRLPDESKASVEELIVALGHPDRDQRLRAQSALIARGEVEAQRRLIAQKAFDMLRDEKGGVIQRCHAVWVAAHCSGNPGLPGFPSFRIQHWRSDSPSVKRQVIRALARSGKAEFLPDALNDAVDSVRAESLILLRKAAVPTVAEWINERRQGLRRPESIYEEGLEKALQLLNDRDEWVRFQAGRTMRSLVISAEKLSGKLAAARESTLDVNWQNVLKSRIDGAKDAAADPVWSCLDESFVEGVVGFLSDYAHAHPTGVRARAVTALGAIAYQPKPYDGHWWGTQPVKNPPPPHSVAWAGTPAAIAALTAALGDADTGVRLAAARALALGTGPEPLPALRARLSAETDPAVRRQLIETLGVQKDAEAMKLFCEIALGDPDMAFREVAIGAVVNIGGDEAKKAIAQLAGSQLSPAATRKIIQAAGELRVLEAAPALIAHLAGDNPGDRQAAIKALAQLGPKAGATQPLIAALSDPDEKVKQAALEALGSLRDKAALPALLEFAKTKKNAKELIAALSAMPDPQSIPVLVNALRDANSGLRRNALKALKTMREAALPPIEELLASGKIPREFEPEIRAAFDSGAIVKWKMIGPFENVWAAVHPPEKDVLAAGWPMTESPSGNIQRHPSADYTKGLLAKRYTNAEGKEVGWIDVTASTDDGHVDLEKVFHTTGMVCAYAYAEIESPGVADAKLLCGSDDQIAVWLNGAKVHDSGPASRSYSPDQDAVPLRLVGGTNQLFVKIGNVGGGWEFAARIPGVTDGKFTPPKDTPPDVKQRAYVLAQNADGTWTHRGDAKRGEKIFHDPTGPLGGICAQCHKVSGLGAEVGPDLSLVGSVYKRGDLLTSILEPSKTIALGYEQVVVEAKGGDIFAGAIRKETDDALTILGSDMRPHLVNKADIKTRKPVETSIMPAGLTLGLKPEELADLLAYMESLRGN